jgi:hypothetical protein
MRRFVEGIDRGQATLFPECLEDWIDGDNPVRAIDAFVDKLDLPGLGFDGVAPETTGRPSYHPSGLLKLYIYGSPGSVAINSRLANATTSERRMSDAIAVSGDTDKEMCLSLSVSSFAVSSRSHSRRADPHQKFFPHVPRLGARVETSRPRSLPCRCHADFPILHGGFL